MINLTFESFNGNRPYFIIGSVAAILFTVVAHIWSSRSNLTQYPLLGEEQYRNTTKRKEAYLSCVALLFDEGYKKFKRQIYRITTSDGMISFFVTARSGGWLKTTDLPRTV